MSNDIGYLLEQQRQQHDGEYFRSKRSNHDEDGPDLCKVCEDPLDEHSDVCPCCGHQGRD